MATAADDTRPDTRLRILDAAATAFLQQGYGGARLAQIAKSAGVSRSTLYELFPGKEQLLAGINHLVIAESIAQAQLALTGAESSHAALRNWLRGAMQLRGRYRTLLKIMHSDEAQPNLLLDREATVKSIQDVQKIVRKLLREGIASGEFRADLPINRTAQSLQNFHYLLTRQAAADFPLFDLGADNGDTLIDLLLRGLTPNTV